MNQSIKPALSLLNLLLIVACSSSDPEPAELVRNPYVTVVCLPYSFGLDDVFTYDATGRILKRDYPAFDYDLKYSSGKIEIFRTDPSEADAIYMVYEVGSDGEPLKAERTDLLGKHVYTTRFSYESGLLAKSVTTSSEVEGFRDSLIVEYDPAGKNILVMVSYYSDDFGKTYIQFERQTFTYDDKPNPRRGMLLDDNFIPWVLSANNMLTRTRETNTGAVVTTTNQYTYNAKGLPVTSSFNGGDPRVYLYIDCD